MSLADKPWTSEVPRRNAFSAIILARRAGRLALVLDHVPALGREQRRLDVLGEQLRIVAAPGADDDALVVLRMGAAAPRRRQARPHRRAPCGD